MSHQPIENHQPITAATRFGVVIGKPVGHSASPALHNAAFAAAKINAVFLAWEVADPDLHTVIDGLAAVSALGASITVPHKQAAMDRCSRLAALAAEIGAVNCLCFEKGGEIVGHNTDAGGFVDALHAAVEISLAGSQTVLLGAGGAARAVYAGIKAAGAASIQVIARTPAKAAWVPGAALPWQGDVLEQCLASCDLLVDCTSSSLSASAETQLPVPIPISRLPAHAVVSSLVYHREPALLARARQRSLRTVDGAGMLVHQAARAFTLWTGKPAPIEAMQRAM